MYTQQVESVSPRFISSLPARASRGGRTCPSGFPVSRWKASWTSPSVPLILASITVSNVSFTVFLFFYCQNIFVSGLNQYTVLGSYSNRISVPARGRYTHSLAL